jgi:hypothetical protein
MISIGSFIGTLQAYGRLALAHERLRGHPRQRDWKGDCPLSRKSGQKQGSTRTQYTSLTLLCSVGIDMTDMASIPIYGKIFLSVENRDCSYSSRCQYQRALLVCFVVGPHSSSPDTWLSLAAECLPIWTDGYQEAEKHSLKNHTQGPA